MDTDELLVKGALNGNGDSFRSIVEKYQGLVFAICFNITGHKQEAENLSQETFIQVYRSLNKYENKSFKAWIGRIATNKAIDWKRKMRFESEAKVLYVDDISEISIEDNIDEQLIKKENSKKVFEICGRLPDIYSTVLIKHYIQSKSYNEISKEFEEHLIECDECNEKYIEFIELQQIEIYSDQLSPQFTDNVMGLISTEPKQTKNTKKKKVIPEVLVYYVAAACITLVFSLNGVFDSLLVGVSDMTKSIAQSPVQIEKAISNGWTERLANDTSKVISKLRPDIQ